MSCSQSSISRTPRPGGSVRDDLAVRRFVERGYLASVIRIPLASCTAKPAKTLRIQAEIDAAFGSGDMVFAGDGNYYCCPWSAIYRVIRPIVIAGARLRRGKPSRWTSRRRNTRGWQIEKRDPRRQFLANHEYRLLHPRRRRSRRLTNLTVGLPLVVLTLRVITWMINLPEEVVAVR